MASEGDNIANIEAAALTELAAISELDVLETWRVAYLGRRGRVTQILRGLSDISSVEERRRRGAEANQIKSNLETACRDRHAQISETRVAHAIEDERLDITLPGPPLPRARLHPITQTLRDVLRAFSSMGFQIAEGPEIEWDHYNFEALRIPADHPARDMWDTLWIDYERDGRRQMLLRTHTSPAQIRIMEEHKPPIRVAVPGRAYRFEATDTTHEWMMTQVEVLAIDEGLSLAHMKGTLLGVMRRLFGSERRIRLQCSYFPFVEPGAEVAMDCFVCSGAGCATCHGTGWIEMGGAGMVHPEILENMGIDSSRYTGFAAGMG